MARAVCITNPAAARTNNRSVRALEAMFKGAGWGFDTVWTEAHGNARELAAQALAAGVDQVVVYGGDGTAMQAAAALIGTDVPVGLVAGGTGNILAGNLRLPRRPRSAARVLLRGRTRRIDVGRVERSDGVHYFAVCAGSGFDAVMMYGTSAMAKRRWGMLAYMYTAVKALSGLKAVPHRISVDGQATEFDATMVLVANCPELVPYVFPLGRHIQNDDGTFEVVIARANSVLQAVRAAWHLRTGTQHPGSLVHRLRGSTIALAADDIRPVQLDGEPAGVLPLTVTLVPKALSVVVP